MYVFFYQFYLVKAIVYVKSKTPIVPALSFHSRAAWITPSFSQRRPVTLFTAVRWCPSCCLSVTASRTSPMASTVCTASTVTISKRSSRLLTQALCCRQDITAHTSYLSSTAGEDLLQQSLHYDHRLLDCFVCHITADRREKSQRRTSKVV